MRQYKKTRKVLRKKSRKHSRKHLRKSRKSKRVNRKKMGRGPPLGLKPKNIKHQAPSRIPLNKTQKHLPPVPTPYNPPPSAPPLPSEFPMYKKNKGVQKLNVFASKMPEHEQSLAKSRSNTLDLKQKLGLL